MRFPTVLNPTTLLTCFTLVGSVAFTLPGLAQNTSEIGGGIGGMNYRGEISPNYRLLNNRLAATGFYRRDLSSAITARGNLSLGWLRAADADVQRRGVVLPVPALRQAALRGFLVELMAGLEYNFLDYYDQKRRTRWTPYFFTGLAGYFARNEVTSNVAAARFTPVFEKRGGSRIAVALPVGVGIKYALSYHWNLGVEFGARRTFGDKFDYLFNLNAPDMAQPGDTDWYYYNGFSLSYTFYRVRCPDIYRSQPNLLR